MPLKERYKDEWLWDRLFQIYQVLKVKAQSPTVRTERRWGLEQLSKLAEKEVHMKT